MDIIGTAAGGCTDENTTMTLFVVPLLHGEAGDVLLRPSVQRTSLHPGFVQLPEGLWGDIFVLSVYNYQICISDKGRKKKFNSSWAQ